MILLKTLSFFLDASGSHSGPAGESSPEHSPVFATERLTSSAWEGWWDEPIRAFPPRPDPFQKAGSGDPRSELHLGLRQADKGDRTAVVPLQFKADVPRPS